jgi:hypothetical protein
MTLALVFAMTGGAYAANKFLITSTKQISPKVLKALKGKAGAPGPAGTAGPAGAAGAGTAGAAGPQGPAGSAGAKGETGPKGETGKTGPQGEEGTFGGETLPVGKSLTGHWAGSGYGEIGYPNAGYGSALGAVSYALPLAEEPTAHVINEGEKGVGGGTCPTTSEASKPEAEPGNLCIFVTHAVNALGFSFLLHQDKVGFTVTAISPAKGTMSMEGTWAVNA